MAVQAGSGLGMKPAWGGSVSFNGDTEPAMRITNTKISVGNKPESAARSVIMEVVSEFDASADLTTAYDFCRAFDGAFETHLVGIGRNSTPIAGHDGTHWLREDGQARDAVLAALFEQIRPDVVHTHRVNDLAFFGPAARTAGVPVLLHTACGDIATAELSRIEHFREVVNSLGPLVVVPSVEAACHINPATRVAVIPRGIDCTRYRPGSQARARRKIGLPAGPPRHWLRECRRRP
jgi:glycosyltransferase involved in cell wall biosynthesis